MNTASEEILGKVHYFITKYRSRYNGYPNAETSFWNYIPDVDSELEFSLDLNMNHPNPCMPDIKWQEKCDKYIEFYFGDEEFMNEMTKELLEVYLNIIPFKDDIKRRQPNVYNLSDPDFSPFVRVIETGNKISLYKKQDLEGITIPELIDAELAEHLSSLDHFTIDFDNLDDEIELCFLVEGLEKFLREADPEFFKNLKEGDGIFFGDWYRNDGYFFFNGSVIVPISYEEVPGTHDYGIPPFNLRMYYPFTWSTYGFLTLLE